MAGMLDVPSLPTGVVVRALMSGVPLMRLGCDRGVFQLAAEDGGVVVAAVEAGGFELPPQPPPLAAQQFFGPQQREFWQPHKARPASNALVQAIKGLPTIQAPFPREWFPTWQTTHRRRPDEGPS